jgi:hypothetical protein
MLTTLSVLFLAASPSPSPAIDFDAVAVLRDATGPIFSGAAVIIPVIVLLIGIHKMVDHRTENHAVLLAEMFGFMVVAEGAMLALRHLIDSVH